MSSPKLIKFGSPNSEKIELYKIAPPQKNWMVKWPAQRLLTNIISDDEVNAKLVTLTQAFYSPRPYFLVERGKKSAKFGLYFRPLSHLLRHSGFKIEQYIGKLI